MEINIPILQVDGGATANNFLMQFQSDILQINIDRPKNIESTAIGAGMLAGIGAGFWSNSAELKEIRVSDKIFIPSADNNTRTSLLLGWEQAIKQARHT